ncbi:MAG: Wzt carbohydrate-binding domain-containing protein, partial [Candidatus Neomarinimicrobiota bacterium]
GRENIYLNGAILGMKKAEIDRKFDEIVSFAEVERFVDTPIKHYSSGMYVRLAFAVAAHLDPDILLVDEVLAVGDASFQKKCLGKMGDVAKEGRTVLFVSHNMGAVEKLCNRALVLNEGHFTFAGERSEAITFYLRTLENLSGSGSLQFRSDRKGTGEVRVVNIEVRDTEGNSLDAVCSSQDIDILLRYEATSDFPPKNVIASIALFTDLGVPVFNFHNRLTGDTFGSLPLKGALVCRLYRLPLVPSTYRIHFSIRRAGDSRYLDYLDNALRLTVIEGDFYGTGEMHPPSSGMCLVDGSWRLEAESI